MSRLHESIHTLTPVTEVNEVLPGWPEHVFAGSDIPRMVEMETETGETFIVRCARWHRAVGRADVSILSRCCGPVLDVGCGPGRHVAALRDRGYDALGIDTSAAAVASTIRRGAAVAQVSVFDDVPRAGEWGTALLLDGNIGIGGNVPDLLVRVGQLLRPGGLALVETTSPEAFTGAAQVRIRDQDLVGEWFPWAWITANRLGEIAAAAGLIAEETWHLGGRWFVQLRSTAFPNE